MGKLYDALLAAQGKRLAEGNDQNTEPTSSLLPPQTGTPLASMPKLNDESELKALAQNIAARLPHSDQNVIQFIGSKVGEGTSTLIREFAITLSQQSSKPVLLVDADIKHPSQAQAFGLEPKPPIDYVLKEGKALDGVISQIEQSKLFLATLSPQFFRSLTERSYFHSTDMWKAARDQFSLILIDSSPVSVSSDSLALCESVNGVVLVVAAERTRAAVAQNLKTQILKREGNLLGIVCTKRKFHIPKFIHKFF